ncbi:hypothetical protein G9464_11410 [Halostella sp. JP-L12]|uniref:LVIVD repeat-containing protein n=1 Tax=Halostella TaxID=1843185 RepID=UPI000EF7A077|nr:MULTISPECIES: hypothetical protein [Halostella]NHN48205.1 hypothetical protein [Halostella sp. JP-L12]
MRRRDVLRAGAGAVALSAVGDAAALNGPVSRSLQPYASIDVERSMEAVVNDDGSAAFVAADSGFATVDVSSPEDPQVLAEERELLPDRENGPLPNIQDVKVSGDTLAVAGPAYPVTSENADRELSGVLIYDVSDPASPEQRGFFETETGVHNCCLDGDTLYATGTDFQEEALVVADVSGDNPEEIGRWSLPQHDEQWGQVNGFLRSHHDLWVQDDTAYLAQWDAGTVILDVSDPASPEFVARVGGRDPAELAEFEGQAEVYGEGYQPPGNAHYVRPSEDGSTLFVGAEAWNFSGYDVEGGPGGIDIWDVSDPTAAEQVGRIDPPEAENPNVSGGTWTTSHNFDLSGDVLYTSWYDGGVRVHDVSDPANPEELAAWEDRETASFWTAQVGVAGEFFVGTTYPRAEGFESGLYTFPDEWGGGADGDEGGSDGGSDETTQQSDGNGSDGNDSDGNDDGSGGVEMPGFGIGAALAGAGLGALRYLRNDNER